MIDARPTILVTGGAGYIGSHACKALDAAGYRPVVVDNLAYGHEWAVQWGPLEHGDIADQKWLNTVIERHKPDAVIHFAAFAYVGESVTNPGKYYRNNVAGTIVLLEAMRDHAISRIIFSSTCATYGIPKVLPIAETTPQQPINPYGASKLMVERILSDFETAHATQWIALRYFNAAGADPAGTIGEAHNPETHLIPLTLDAATGRRGALSVFGSDYDTRDGTCVRDYIHVTDLAHAHVLALKALERGTSSQAINLGNGAGFTVKEVIAAVERVTGLRVPHTLCPRRAGDPPALISASTVAREILGWIPQYPDLDRIIADAWAWHQRPAT